MKYNLREIINLAKNKFTLNLDGIHGIAHWERVRQNGLMIAKHNGADKNIVELFAFLHDCCRIDDGGDPDHGKRAAEYIKTLRGKYIHIDHHKFNLLCEACEYHTKGRTRADTTVMTCWDADRLDLWRVGIKPTPKFLCTKYAKKRNIIEKCCQNIKNNKKKEQNKLTTGCTQTNLKSSLR